MIRNLTLELLCLVFSGYVFPYAETVDEEQLSEVVFITLAHEYIAIMRDMRKLDYSPALQERIEQLFSEDFVMVHQGRTLSTRATLYQSLMQASRENRHIRQESERLVMSCVKDRCFYIRSQIVDEQEGKTYKAVEIVTFKDGVHIDKSELFIG